MSTVAYMMDSQPSSTPVNVLLGNRLAKLAELHAKLPSQPYSIILHLELALAYQALGYPDLAIGDAYKALLLVDEVAEELEYHEEALDAARSDIASKRAIETAGELRGGATTGLDHVDCSCRTESGDDVRGQDEVDDSEATIRAKECWSKTAHAILIECLIDCGCLQSAFDYNSRALQSFGGTLIFESYREKLQLKLRSHFESKGEDFDAVDVQEYPDKGLVRREKYPWSDYEPDRFSPESLQFLNDEMSSVAPKLEVRITELPVLAPWGATSCETSHPEQHEHCVKQLGVFAKEDIPAGEVILQEKSILTAGIERTSDWICNACSIPLPTLGDEGFEDVRSCEECDDTYFCGEECEDLAQSRYHPAICGVNFDQKVPSSESSDLLYTLLLVRALALAEVQEVHPLELKEVRYIWGDYHTLNLDKEWKSDPQGHLPDPFGTIPQTLPFSFQRNILIPLNILEKMDINIFEQAHRYDTWIFNTLYAKFRGTASARQGPDRKPEVSAVHPMWCLANHSCDPKVDWEWQGSMKFWTREKLVDWKGRSSDVQPGIRKGEEVLSHYCDVSLPVKERREWAVGALGGDCMCPRCLWEAAEEKTHEVAR